MKAMQYDMIVETTQLEGDTNIQAQVCEQGEGCVFIAAGCGELRVNGIDGSGQPNLGGTQATDSSVFGRIDANAALASVQACQGGLPDFESCLDPGIPSAGLPFCFYTFGSLVAEL